MSAVSFFSFRSGLLTLSPSDIAKAMYTEAVLPNQYDYKDPDTGLSFQLISPTRLFIADPNFPIVKLILTAKWQVLYDASFSGPGKLKFVTMSQDVTVSTNWKTLNEVLVYHGFTGTLPVSTPEQVYMSVVRLDDSMYIVGTLFTPSQPYVRLVLTGTQTIATTTEARIAYNSIDDQVGVEEADRAQMVPVLTGANAGAVRLKVAGLYLVEADVGLTVTRSTYAQLSIKINGVTRKVSKFFIFQGDDGTEGNNPSTVGTIRIKRSDLADTTYPGEARLEVTLQNGGAADATLSTGSAELTALSVTFLG